MRPPKRTHSTAPFVSRKNAAILPLEGKSRATASSGPVKARRTGGGVGVAGELGLGKPPWEVNCKYSSPSLSSILAQVRVALYSPVYSLNSSELKERCSTVAAGTSR